MKKLFSFVELIVVLAIFAILASLITPSLKKVLASSENTICQKNLQKIGVAAYFYLDDNRHILPSCFYDETLGGRDKMPIWNDKFSIYLGGHGDGPALNLETYNCPSLDFPSPNTSSKKRIIDYGWNSAGWGIWKKYGLGHWVDPDLMVPLGGTVAIHEIATPSKMLMVADRAQYPGNHAWNYIGRVGGHSGAVGMVPMLHNFGLNLVHVDGHVEWLTHAYLTSSDSIPLWSKADD